MRKIIKFVVLPLVILVVLLFASFYIYPQIPTVLTYKFVAVKKLASSVNVTPTKHTVSSIPKKQGKTYEYDGVSVTTDWSEKEIRDSEYSKFIVFSNDELIVLNGKEMNIDLYDNLKQEMLKKADAKNVDTYFSNSGIRSNQDIYEKMLSITKKDVGINKTMDELTLNMILLTLKGAMLLDTEEVLTYKIGNTTYYQYSPLNNKTVYEIVFFDSLDNQHSISIKKAGISQQEIESIVKTIEVKNF